MTDHIPPTEQQLDEIAARAMLGSWGIYEHGNDGSVTNITDEVRRLRTESEQHTEDLASADNPTQLRWGLNDVLWGDDGTVTVLMSGPEREPYWLEMEPERAAVLREDLAGPPAEVDRLRTAAAAELLPTWEAMYEPGNVSDYLVGYVNSEAAAKGAAEAWMRSESEVTGRLEWVPQTPLDGYDTEFELVVRHDDGIDTAPGITVRHRAPAVPAVETGR